MGRGSWPVCSWSGVAPDGEAIVGCDRPAKAVVIDASGHRVYACGDHLARAKARARAGGGLRAIDRLAAPPGEREETPTRVVIA